MSDPRPPNEVLGYYARGDERERLEQAYFPLERARTQELVRRHLPPPRGVVLDGLRGPVFDHDAFARIVEQDVADGQHRNDTGIADFFTTAFFHQPGELGVEVREAGFTLVGLLAVEGPGAFVPDVARRWADPKARARLVDLVRRVEREPALLGASPHLLAVGQR